MGELAHLVSDMHIDSLFSLFAGRVYCIFDLFRFLRLSPFELNLLDLKPLLSCVCPAFLC